MRQNTFYYNILHQVMDGKLKIENIYQSTSNTNGIHKDVKSNLTILYHHKRTTKY